MTDRHRDSTISPRSVIDSDRWIMALPGGDRIADLAPVVALFAAFVALDRATAALVVVTPDDLTRPSLVVAALGHRWAPAVVLGVAVTVLALDPDRRRRLLGPWRQLDHGPILRLLASMAVGLTVWSAALYERNWLAATSHLPDRLLVVGLGLAVLARPAALVAFVAVARIVHEQFVHPFATTAGRNIDELVLMTLLAVAAVHLLHALTGHARTAPVVLVITAMVAAHFFVPGRAKLAIGWATSDIANLALASHAAGWRADAGGGWAQFLHRFFTTFRLPVMVATLALELGAVVAVLHPRLTRWWLPGCIAFHIMTFITTGFWFGPWILVEVGLLTLLWTPTLRPWMAENATVGRGLLAAAAVLAAPLVFHPPALAWLDAPVSYGYRMVGTGVSGATYNVSPSAFEPLDHQVAFNRLQLGDTVPASGAYGAVATVEELETLDAIGDFDQLTALEATLTGPTLIVPSQEFLARFVESTSAPRSPWTGLGPPAHFWSSSPEPGYRFQEPLRELEVRMVRVLHHHGNPEYRSETVLRLAVNDDGRAVPVGSD